MNHLEAAIAATQPGVEGKDFVPGSPAVISGIVSNAKEYASQRGNSSTCTLQNGPASAHVRGFAPAFFAPFEGQAVEISTGTQRAKGHYIKRRQDYNGTIQFDVGQNCTIQAVAQPAGVPAPPPQAVQAPVAAPVQPQAVQAPVKQVERVVAGMAINNAIKIECASFGNGPCKIDWHRVFANAQNIVRLSDKLTSPGAGIVRPAETPRPAPVQAAAPVAAPPPSTGNPPVQPPGAVSQQPQQSAAVVNSPGAPGDDLAAFPPGEVSDEDVPF